MDNLVVGLAGAGGDGIVSAGETLVSALAAEGYFAILTKSFGSQIRGGESSCRIRAGTTPVLNPGGILDVAVVLNWRDFGRFGPELPLGPATLLIHERDADADSGALPDGRAGCALVRAVPITELASAAGSLLAKNSVVLGLLGGWLGLPLARLEQEIRRKFAEKGAVILSVNERAFAAGLDYTRQFPLGNGYALRPAPTRASRPVLTDGNEICARAALFAGCKFFGGYPITPATEIMEHLDRDIWHHGGTLLQAEDEIAGAAAAIGASFAGRKAMTATSGPGFSLMAEVLGLASIAELPLVCVNVQRAGPSTGIPTKREQSDLFAAAYSSHGDSVRPVLAPTGVADTFDLTVEAFNIAEQYQTPVILLSDQELAQRKEVIAAIDTTQFHLVDRREPGTRQLKDYRRFRLTRDGISPLSHPGMKGGNYLAAGIEHDERGAPSASGRVHTEMTDKRAAKFAPLHHRGDLFFVEGEPDASIGVISWGSTAGVALEALRLARTEGIEVKLLVPKLLYPVAEEIYREFFASLSCCCVVEQSKQGQLFRLLRMWTQVPRDFFVFAKSGANPISPEEVLGEIRQMTRRNLSRHRALPAGPDGAAITLERDSTREFRTAKASTAVPVT